MKIKGKSTGGDLLAAVDRAISGEVIDEMLAALQYIAMELSRMKSKSDRLEDFALAVLSKAEQAIAKAEEVK